jgi:hypothetical protein
MRLSNKERERAKNLQSIRSEMMSHVAVAQSGRVGETHSKAWLARLLSLAT